MGIRGVLFTPHRISRDHHTAFHGAGQIRWPHEDHLGAAYIYSPQADNPVLWEAVLMLFLVRCTLPWATANVSLLVGVIMVRWGYMFSARAWRWSLHMRAMTTQTE